LAIAKAEIDHPNHSLRPNEVREITKIDRAGRPVTEFHTKLGPMFWMQQFTDPLISLVSGGSAGIGRDVNMGCVRFDKSNYVPEAIALKRQAEYEASSEYRIKQVYVENGLVPPSDLEIAKMMGKV
jgi:hypothetical protein